MIKQQSHQVLRIAILGFLFLFIFIGSCKKDEQAPESIIPTNPELVGLIPFELQIESTSLSEKKLIWSFNYTAINGFKVDRKVGDNPWQVAYLNVPKDQYFAIDAEVIPDSSLTYQYRVYAWAGNSVSLFASIEETFLIDPPTNFKILQANDVVFTLSWHDVVNGETGYKIDRKFGTSEWQNEFKVLGPDVTFFTDSLIGKSTNVYYRVYTAWNEFSSVKVDKSTAFSLDAPEIFSSIPLSISQNQISWHDKSDGEQGFKIDRKLEGGDWEIAMASLPANTTTFTDDDIPCNSNTSYRVYAYAGSFDSPGDVANIENLVPEPTNIDIDMVSLSDVRIRWNDNSEGESGFRIDRRLPGASWEEYWKQPGANTTEAHDASFPLSASVQYRISTIGGSCESATVLGSVSTQIPGITYFHAVLTSDDRIKLTWNSYVSGEEGFKIDRKIGSGSWEIAFASTGPDEHTMYDDNQYPVGENIFYRVYSYYQGHTSDYEEESVRYCAGVLTDSRDGQEYDVTLIGDQCWMAENLNVGEMVDLADDQSDNGVIEKFCYEDHEVNCLMVYGGMYRWDEAMGYNLVLGGRGICPEGWHIPQDTEWEELISYAGGEDYAGKRMKSTSTWYNGGNGIDAYGYNALPAGQVDDNEFEDKTKITKFWASSWWGTGQMADYYILHYNNDGIVSYTNHFSSIAYSVRCVKD